MADISRNDVWTLWQAIQNAVEGTIDVELTGSSVQVEEHMWLDSGAEPTPTADVAVGIEVAVATGEMSLKYWDGDSWEDLA